MTPQKTSRLLLAGIAVVTLFVATAAFAASKSPTATGNDLTPQFRDRGLSTVDRLQVTEVGGIVVMRGRVAARANAEEASQMAKDLGYSRVANLIQVVEPIDDRRIERTAEREIAIHRSLDGCKLSVDSDKGIVRINGIVSHELQKDVVISLIRNIDGVREVRTELARN